MVDKHHPGCTFPLVVAAGGAGPRTIGGAHPRAGTHRCGLGGGTRILSEGRILEKDSRWLEALGHYDQAVREYPDAQDLRLRRTLAHIHVDLDRRLADSSFASFVSTASRQQVLGMYQEICLKVQSHYVHEPNWQKLTWRGTANLDVAVSKPEFQQRHMPQAKEQEITEFRRLLRNSVNKRVVASRTDARDLMVYATGLAEQYLSLSPAVCMAEYCSGAISSLDHYSTYLTACGIGRCV